MPFTSNATCTGLGGVIFTPQVAYNITMKPSRTCNTALGGNMNTETKQCFFSWCALYDINYDVVTQTQTQFDQACSSGAKMIIMDGTVKV